MEEMNHGKNEVKDSNEKVPSRCNTTEIIRLKIKEQTEDETTNKEMFY